MAADLAPGRRDPENHLIEGKGPMKISLNMGQQSGDTQNTDARVLEKEILGAKKGDWNAKSNLTRKFIPLLTSLAQKRSNDPAKINLYIDAGKEGLYIAAKKYNPGSGADRFRLFALDFIEKQMNRVDKKGGFFSRLFGG